MAGPGSTQPREKPEQQWIHYVWVLSYITIYEFSHTHTTHKHTPISDPVAWGGLQISDVTKIRSELTLPMLWYCLMIIASTRLIFIDTLIQDQRLCLQIAPELGLKIPVSKKGEPETKTETDKQTTLQNPAKPNYLLSAADHQGYSYFL